ncbi:thioredoxin [Aquabacter sp. P-9]|uniref:thioredoxin n=1 Tax=Aquabacter sediminis TaxID=3029197 RepID=UPI00237D6FF3|nr:thioredoxin [Aquabacter sp. P-9]MDE1571217.1 thioredoxin [Aquabacter sp. P-9]
MLFKQAGGPQAATPGGQAGADDVTETTTQTFMADVIEESRRRPVLVDFWAPWCGPCKTLGPIIERAVAATKGKVKLVKMNIDEHPAVAQQLRIQSIPTVYAFVNGQPVDGFMGALPESQIKAFIERLMGGPADADIAEVLAAADAALAEGDAAGAAEIFAHVLAQEPDNLKALGGLVRAQVAGGAIDQAKATLGMVPAGKEGDSAITAAKAALDLAEQAAALGDLATLQAKVDIDPLDHQSRFDLALGLNGRGRREQALIHLLDIVKRDRSWNEDAARKQLLQLFEAWGPTDPLTISGRKKLSAILFA